MKCSTAPTLSNEHYIHLAIVLECTAVQYVLEKSSPTVCFEYLVNNFVKCIRQSHCVKGPACRFNQRNNGPILKVLKYDDTKWKISTTD